MKKLTFLLLTLAAGIMLGLSLNQKSLYFALAGAMFIAAAIFTYLSDRSSK